MANILFVHQNFPGQFPHIAVALKERGHKIAAIGSKTAKGVPGIDVRRWNNSRTSTPNIFPAATKSEADFIRAEAAAYAAMTLKGDGFLPDLIIGHPGWGETLYMPEVFPGARMILLNELFYRPRGYDVAFDPEFDNLDGNFGQTMNIVGKNASAALAYTQCDRLIVPTPFQASSFPALYHPIMRVLHEGVNFRWARRRLDARLKLPNGRTIDARTPTITFINRSFERVRGFHIFMRALPKLLAECSEAQVVLIGQEEHNTYGGNAPDGRRWKDWMLDEVGGRLDMSRVHFMGRVPHETMIAALSISWAHVYYTVPFVLSWSLIEAMGCECLVIASDTAPLHDAVTSGVDGLLLPFFDIDALSAAMIRAVREPEAFLPLRAAARPAAMAKFDLHTIGLPGWMEEVDTQLARR